MEAGAGMELERLFWDDLDTSEAEPTSQLAMPCPGQAQAKITLQKLYSV